MREKCVHGYVILHLARQASDNSSMQGEPIEHTPLVDAERRRQGRIPCEDLRCNLGKVFDLSAEGARVLVRRFKAPLVGRHISVEVKGYGISVTLDARIMRSTRIAFGQHDVGLKFDNLTVSQRQIICDLVRTHSVRYSIVRAMA